MDDETNVVPFDRRRAMPAVTEAEFPRIEICRCDESGGYIVGIVFGREDPTDFILVGYPATYGAAIKIARLKQAGLRSEMGRVQIVDFSTINDGIDLGPETVA